MNSLLFTQLEMDHKSTESSDLDVEVKIQAKVFEELWQEEEYRRLKYRSTWLKDGYMNVGHNDHTERGVNQCVRNLQTVYLLLVKHNASIIISSIR